ncbi:arginine N-succinyltransferase [Sphingomonas xinjiangensis]|uniref:Arginine N-succinyltransferase n=2 Tax=Sphingomonas xinjiangensis TaxID=643568 RepID=A0A840YJU7_9SPHN|nr:arginine N-succinyltransferase [Sphingomonas xinjiangensis]
MAKLTGGGFTNLPPERPSLQAKLVRSHAAFARQEEGLFDDLFVLVLENADTGDIRGTCQIFTHVGQTWPFYSYRIGTVTKHSQALNRTFRAQILNLVNDLEGCSEVGGLFLHPNERAGGLGMLLARSRYLFIARHRARFADRILAELRGVIDEAGASPFWDGVAGRFFGMNFQEADVFNATHGNQFIADLMPKHPIYTAMLNEHARAVMGIPHPTGRAAMRMLENEGFVFEHYIDIFDGGPTMMARTDQVKTIRGAITSTVIGIGEADGAALISTGHLAEFRVAHGYARDTGEGVIVDAVTARLLNLQAGDEIVHVTR